jgi:hypothetical protein
MNLVPIPKVVLQNKLSKCREKLQELSPIIENKRRAGITIQWDHLTMSLSGKDFDHCAKLFKSNSPRTSVDDISEVSVLKTFFS